MKTVLFSFFLALAISSSAQSGFYTPWIGRSTGKLPALAYGLGEDRLGGAKMGYIDSNIALRVMDTI
ncbi:MAG: hypothetical protein ACK4S0_13695, partial [Sediminibacterium sp.]